MSLAELRAQIDGIDRELVQLLSRRAEAAVAIGVEKRRQSAEIHDQAREEAVLAQAVACNRGPLSETEIRAIFQAIMAACSRVQGAERTRRV